MPARGRWGAVPSRLPHPATGPPVGFAAAAADERRRAGDLGIRTPPRPSGTATWPSVGRSASPSASQRPPERLPNPRVYSRVPPESETVPVNAVFSASLTPRDSPRLHPYLEQQFDTGTPSASWHPPSLHGLAYTDPTPGDAGSPASPCNRPPRKDSGRKAATTPTSLRAVRADRQIDSKKPPRYTRCHRVGPLPRWLFISGMGGFFHRNTHLVRPFNNLYVLIACTHCCASRISDLTAFSWYAFSSSPPDRRE